MYLQKHVFGLILVVVCQTRCGHTDASAANELSPCSAFPSAGKHFTGSRDSFLFYDQFPSIYSYDYSFYFQTTSMKGVILFSSEIRSPYEFYSIYIQDGYVKHKVDNGDHDGAQLSSHNTYNDGLYHFVRVTKHKKAITLTVDGESQSGTCSGPYTVVNTDGKVYAGGLMSSIVENKVNKVLGSGMAVGFNGCLWNLTESETGQCMGNPSVENQTENCVCAAGSYGENCTEMCSEHCRDGEDCQHTDGSCEACQDGYVGNKCDTECSPGSYGEECEDSCTGHCLDGATCHHINGSCPADREGVIRCEAGYEGVTCHTKCSPGSYGEECEYSCTGHCLDGATCHHINGSCPADREGVIRCEAGYEGVTCHTMCAAGSYGENCTEMCSEHCRDGEDCQHTDGSCEACQDGYVGNKCDTECSPGFHGEECEDSCTGHCLDGATCHHINGSCPADREGVIRCEAGYEGVTCHTKCSPGSYGEECEYSCTGHCLDGATCHHINGSCPADREGVIRCEAGYEGVTCHTICRSGTYGEKCAKLCSGNCKNSSVCHHVSGECPCQEGYKGDTCHQKCSRNQFEYGENCKSKCSEHCGGVGMCDVFTGKCEVLHCKSGYKGDLCNTDTAGNQWIWMCVGAVCLITTTLVVMCIGCYYKTYKQSHASPEVQQEQLIAMTENHTHTASSPSVYQQINEDIPGKVQAPRPPSMRPDHSIDTGICLPSLEADTSQLNIDKITEDERCQAVGGDGHCNPMNDENMKKDRSLNQNINISINIDTILNAMNSGQQPRQNREGEQKNVQMSELKSSSITCNSAKLDWKAAVGATNYDISVTGKAIISTDKTEYLLTDLIPNTQYTVEVTPKNDRGTGESQSITVSTLQSNSGYALAADNKLNKEQTQYLWDEIGPSVCRIIVPGNTGTGFVVGSLQNSTTQQEHFFILTCYHVKIQDAILNQHTQSCYAEFGYTDQSQPATLKVKIAPTNFACDEKLDYILVALEHEPQLLGFVKTKMGNLIPKHQTPSDREPLIIIGHPDGKELQIDPAAYCVPRPNNTNKPHDYIFYQCRSFHGASGAPVMSKDKRLLFAMHCGGSTGPARHMGPSSEVEHGVALWEVLKDIKAKAMGSIFNTGPTQLGNSIELNAAYTLFPQLK